MEILFKNITTYSKDSYDKFLEFHRKKFRFKFTLFNIIAVVAILTCIVYLVSFHIYSTAIIFCVFLTGFIFFRFIKPVYDVKKNYESEKIINEKTFTFTFYDKFFTIEDEENFIKMKYKDLYKVFENGDFFYLYIDENYSLLVEKAGFVKGDCSCFYEFVKKKSKFLSIG